MAVNNHVKKIIILLSLVFVCFFGRKTTRASEYTNAYDFYKAFAEKNNQPAYLNRENGYVYFCSWGTTATTSTRYATVGYTISILYGSKTDSVEVKLDGTIIKNISEVKNGSYTYVLRRCKLSKIQELFHDNSGITYNQIFRKSNKYKFDAIMTVVQNGTKLCGKISEDLDAGKISAEKNSNLYRTAREIKAARNWANPDDLDNFYNRITELPSYSGLDVLNVMYSGDALYEDGNICYVRKDSRLNLGVYSYLKDSANSSLKYHPNMNVLNISSSGLKQRICIKQATDAWRNPKGGVIEGSSNNIISYGGIDYSATSEYKADAEYFSSTQKFDFTTADGNSVYVVPEGRIYYASRYPEDESDTDNLCDSKVKSSAAKQFICDGAAPQIEVTLLHLKMNNEPVSIPFTVTDSVSGIAEVKIRRSDGAIVYDEIPSSRTQTISPQYGLKVNADSRYSYRIEAVDNVGHMSASGNIRFIEPNGYTVVASATGGKNGYNNTLIDATVDGGNSEICSFVIMSEDEDNASGNRIIVENQNTDNGEIEHGMYSLAYTNDIMPDIKKYPDGAYYFDVISGGRYVASEPVRLLIKKDITKPVITTPMGVPNNAGWFKKNVVVQVKSTDNYSGIANINVKCNDTKASLSELTYLNLCLSGKFTISTEGNNVIDIYSEDMAGNKAVVRKTVNIDKTPPVCEIRGNLKDSRSQTWVNKENFTGEIKLSDSVSGIWAKAPFDPFLIRTSTGVSVVPDYYFTLKKENGEYTITLNDTYKNAVSSGEYNFVIDVYDRAGNNCFTNAYINVDCDVPVYSIPDEQGWNKSDMKGKVCIKDAHSGLARLEVKCGNATAYTQSFSGDKEKTVALDMSSYKGKGIIPYMIITDVVGNKASYPLETAIQKKKLRTRIR